MHIGDANCEVESGKSRVITVMSGEQRILLASHLTFIEREITKTRLREEHPEWSEKRVMIEMVRFAFLPDPLPAWLERRFMEECEQFRPEAAIG